MNVLCLNVFRLCVPNIMSLGICLKKLHLVKVDAFAWYSVKIHFISGVRFEIRKVDKKSKPTRELKHTNSILEYFEYFCQISSKAIIIISSYTISKFMHFLRHSVHCSQTCCNNTLYHHYRCYHAIIIRQSTLCSTICF